MAGRFRLRELVRALSCQSRYHAPLLAIVVIQAGCTPSSPSSAPLPRPRLATSDSWVLTSFDPNSSKTALLWNGEIGIRIGSDGHGVGPIFSIDEYGTTGEEKIRELANPVIPVIDDSSNELLSNGSGFETVRNYKQTLDMRTGILRGEWDQPDGYRPDPLHVICETVLHPTKRLLAQRWTIRATRLVNCSAASTIPKGVTKLAEKVLTQDKDIVESFSGLPTSSMNWKLRSRQVSGPLRPSGSDGLTKEFVGELIWRFGESPNRLNMLSGASINIRVRPEPLPDPPTFGEVEAAAKAIWTKRWETDIEIDGSAEDQQAVHSFLFYLRSAISPEGKMSISPFGLSASKYNGHVFWDADIWVFPAMALIDPLAAASIPRYRLTRERQAISNASKWWEEGRPTATGKVSGPQTMFLEQSVGVKYPWESSVSGKETAPGESRFEEHITGDVAFSLGQAASLGLAAAVDADRILQLARWHYLERAEEGAIKAVVSPDESHIGDNDLYTNLLGAWCIYGGSFDPEGPFKEWSVHVPADGTSLLTYDGDSVKSYKQAAAVLSIYPLQFPEAEKGAKVMMDRFAEKTSKNGPAMTDSVHALIWARLGDSDKAYGTWEKSWKDFVTGPFLLFAEKRNHKDTYFTTGAAGCLQTVIYGFLGFRIDSKKQEGALWSTPLALGRILSVKPNLPNSWKSVKFKNFTVLGKRYSLIATHKAVQVIQGDK